jgi:penicillin G amidase
MSLCSGVIDFAEVPGLRAEIQIVRDRYGIPHIRASSAADAWFGMGFACAADRLSQMEYDRRRAAGRWAEVAGAAAVPADVLSRRLSLTESARADVTVMSDPVREMFEAYARGVNAAIGSGVRPAALAGTGLAGLDIEPWLIWHSVAAFKVRHALMGQWQSKLIQAELLARVGPDAFGGLDTRPVPGSPLTVPPGGRLARVIADAVGDIASAGPHLGFLAEAEPGSNAWAVSAARSSHGAAVICNDSHRTLESPNVYWQCHLTCPEFSVIGATFPGVPGFPHFGHNGQVAWAITHGSADTQDLYLEWFDADGWYRTPDGPAQAERRSETILVRDAEPVTVQVWRTRHGPVVHGDPLSGMAIALKDTATCEPGRGFEPLLAMVTARDAAELIDAQREWVDPVNNLVAADTGGRIAYQTRGRLPVRSSGAHYRLPVPGWDGSCEWTGVVPFAAMPRALDPEAGFVMTANNVIVDGDDPYISFTFTQPFRAERLRELLTGTERHSPQDLAAMQGDTLSVAARSWSQVLAGLGPVGEPHQAGPQPDAELARIMLSGWDGDLAAGSAPALLYGCFLRALADALYRPLLGEPAWHWLNSGDTSVTQPMIRRWLANDTWELLGGPGHRAPRTAEVRRVLPGVLASAWRQACQAAGPDPAAWRWGDVHRAGAARALPDATVPAPVRMGGDSDTIQAASYGWRLDTPFDVSSLSVYRQVVDLADPAGASYVIPGGASADPGSPHFADQLAEWAGHRRVPMLYRWPDIESAAESRLTLKPA